MGRFIFIFLSFLTFVTLIGNDIKFKKEFDEAEKSKWELVFNDSCVKDWKDLWTLDGEVATISHSEKGMDYHAGKTYKNDAHHAVLWTKKSFSGDIKIEYEYTKLDDTITGAVTILYIQATGTGLGKYKKDITKWANLRKIPSMKTFYNHMNLFHISYAAFPFGLKNKDPDNDYIRARRYMPLKKKGLKGTELKPDYFRTGLFKKDITYKVTVIKVGQVLFMKVKGDGKEKFCRWVNTLDPVTEGLIGLRHMYTRAARYKNFRVSSRNKKEVLKSDKQDKTKKLDEFDKLRLKWRKMITGGKDYDLTNPEILSKIKAIDEQAGTSWNTMNKNKQRSFIWKDYEEFKKRAWNYKRLFSMSLAWATKGSKFEGNKKILKDILNALKWLNEHRYNKKMPLTRPGWFHPEIYIPKLITDITVLLYDEMPVENRDEYLSAVERFSPDFKLHWGRSFSILTGANRAYKCRVIAIRGILVKDDKKIMLARNGLSNIFKYVTSGDGFYRDGSFIQHKRHPYSGGYGTGLLRDVGYLLQLFEGSRWNVTDPKRKHVYDWVLKAYQPIIFRGNAMDMVRGRTIAFYSGNEFGSGNGILLAAARIAMSAPPKEAKAIKGMIKEWILKNTYLPVKKQEFCGLESLLILNSILNDPTIKPRGDLLLCHQFANMDRTVHHRLGYTFAISMHSNRVYNYENIHGHNKKGWHTGDGMTYLYNNDLTQYSEEFWPTVDMRRLPGTTVILGKAPKHRILNKNPWVGGVDWENRYGATGMWLSPGKQTLSARKSWFLFDDEIVLLGSNIVSKDNKNVESIIENRKLNKSGKNKFIVNGGLKSSTLDWSESLTKVNWAHLTGNVEGANIGYYFPNSANIKGKREARTGTWKDISDLGARERVENGKFTRNFLTLWFDHGVKPTKASYAYVLLPNKNSTQTKKYSDNPDIVILKQNSNVHAVRENKKGLLGANFWTIGPNKIDKITCLGKASIMMGEKKDNELILTIADPTHKGKTIELEIAKVAKKVLLKDKKIKVISLSPTIKLNVNVLNARGRSLKISLTLE